MMQTYLAILADTEGNPDYFHPSEINANSKQEVKTILSENTPPEFIINIFTIQEYRDFINSRQFKHSNTLNQGNTEDGNLFLNNMIEQATNFAEAKEQDNINKQLVKNVTLQSDQPIQYQVVNKQDNIPTMEFEDNGIKYKVEGNHMYKKVWKTVLINPNDPKTNDVIDGNGEFRIISNKTNKEIDYNKYSLQKLDWQLVK